MTDDVAYTDARIAALHAATDRRTLPFGTLRQNARGYWRRKVPTPERPRGVWRFEHELIAEQLLGRALGPLERAVFVDGDHTRCTPDNVAVVGPVEIARPRSVAIAYGTPPSFTNSAAPTRVRRPRAPRRRIELYPGERRMAALEAMAARLDLDVAELVKQAIDSHLNTLQNLR